VQVLTFVAHPHFVHFPGRDVDPRPHPKRLLRGIGVLGVSDCQGAATDEMRGQPAVRVRWVVRVPVDPVHRTPDIALDGKFQTSDRRWFTTRIQIDAVTVRVLGRAQTMQRDEGELWMRVSCITLSL
jgi:hypothetical protein